MSTCQRRPMCTQLAAGVVACSSCTSAWSTFSLSVTLSAAMAVATGLSDAEAAERPFIASMGIYVFRKDVLIKLLKSSFPKVRHSLPVMTLRSVSLHLRCSSVGTCKQEHGPVPAGGTAGKIYTLRSL